MKQNEKRTAGVHVGSASLVLIFAVLCLTVFSTLSFVTAAQERELAEKSAQAIEQYYAADWQCEEQYEQILQELQNGTPVEKLPEILDIQVTKQKNGYEICYSKEIDAYQQLQVVLFASNGNLQTRQWCVKNIQQQTYDDILEVWDGE